ncbi:MAG: cytidylate kinase-like family protein [Spirochaetales bacterium]|nr:cytidylate kinase-like family protein [Candidatus Physcosoma equi]
MSVPSTLQSSPILDQTNKVCQEQSNIIKELSEKSDCIIVGRCADYILRDKKPFRIFIYADMQEKIKRCRAKSKDAESLSDRELEKQIKAIDKNRRAYYDFYTGQEWGAREN